MATAIQPTTTATPLMVVEPQPVGCDTIFDNIDNFIGAKPIARTLHSPLDNFRTVFEKLYSYGSYCQKRTKKVYGMHVHTTEEGDSENSISLYRQGKILKILFI